jgi:hypothetical protein
LTELEHLTLAVLVSSASADPAQAMAKVAAEPMNKARMCFLP